MSEHYLKKELYSLVKSDDRFFDFLQAGAMDGMWYWDLETQADEWMNPRFWELLGYDPREKAHLASEWQDMIFQEDLETALDNFKKHCADPNHPYDQVVRYRHKDGSTVWVRCRGMAIRDETGKPIRMLGVHTDLTAQKMAEEELRNTVESLQKALAEIKVLRGILPICARCKNIRDEQGYWRQVEDYIAQKTELSFEHGLCSDCMSQLYPEFVKENMDRKAN
jgi:PAS domain S-box-containing protein